MGKFIWLIKRIKKIFKQAKENKKQGFENFYSWRKIYDEDKEEHIYYPSVFGSNKG